KKEAMQAIRDGAGNDPEFREYLMGRWFAMSAGGLFRLGGEIARSALMQNPDAGVELFYLLMEDGKRKNPEQPDISRALLAKIYKDKEAGPWAMGLCLTALG